LEASYKDSLLNPPRLLYIFINLKLHSWWTQRRCIIYRHNLI